MLVNLSIRNFKRFESVEVELGNPVVFIGPNNSGKTTALQALLLWDLGVKRWSEKRGSGQAPEKRPGVTINRRDLLSVPVPSAKLLWRDLHTQESERTDDGKTKSTNKVLIEVLVEGVEGDQTWRCGMEFYYANEESFYCRPLPIAGNETERMSIPAAAQEVRLAFLPPMSGLTSNETRLDPGAVQVRLGEGKTAEVLRNLCHQVVTERGDEAWGELVQRVEEMFGATLDRPVYIPERGEITMSYRERGTQLDLSAAGRGLQQTTLLLAYLAANPGSVILVDEPDAHLEILRQREIYRTIAEGAAELGSQIVIASHSEVVLNEAADRDVVIAFVGRPHRIDDRGSQAVKALKEIGFEQFALAEQTGWVLYLEGATDLAILQGFAEVLEHPARTALRRPFVRYVGNYRPKARDHFYGLHESKPDLVGFLITDRLERDPRDSDPRLSEWMWPRREIENYLIQPETLLLFAEAGGLEQSAGPLFEKAERQRHRSQMDECIRDLVPPLALRDSSDPWWGEVKATDEFLDRIFERFYERLGLPNLMQKSDYHRLTRFVPEDQIDPAVSEALDLILETSEKARSLD